MTPFAEKTADQDKYLSDSEIEERAQHLIHAYGLKFGIITRPPVPVERIAEDYLRIRCLAGSLENNDPSVILSVVFFDRIIAVSPRYSHYGSLAFAIAHGIGHWLLHRGEFLSLPLPFPELSQNIDIVCKEEAPNIREDEANRFASALLMPESLLRPFLKDLRLGERDEIERLAKSFSVREQMVRQRLIQLGIGTAATSHQMSLPPTLSIMQEERHIYPAASGLGQLSLPIENNGVVDMEFSH